MANGSAGKPNPFKEARDKLEQAEALRRQGKLDRAETICSTLVRNHPDYFGALHTLGLIYADKKQPERAVAPLFRAAMLNPDSWLTLTALSGVCLELDAKEMAAKVLVQARAIKPNDAGVLVTLAEIYREEREYELARDAFREAATLEPGLEIAAVGLARSHLALGEIDEAAKLLDAQIRRVGVSASALAAIVQLPPAKVEIDILAALAALEKRDNSVRDDTSGSVAFIRAAALDKTKQYELAWEELTKVNRKRFGDKHVQRELREFKLRENSSLHWLKELAAPTSRSQSDHPISLFILGPSRSGKTTLEGLVATLEGVRRGYENPGWENAVSRAFEDAGLLTAWSLENLPPQFYPQCRANYLKELAQRAGSARVFTNTHPMHIHEAPRLVGLIPNVRFIFVKRNVDDLTLRIFMRNYRRGNAYGYDLVSIRDHITWYHEMMDIMAEKFPEIVRTITYEDMVCDPYAALGIAAELCGLDAPTGPMDPIGDDRDCSKPYRAMMSADLTDRA